jgi:hypothetical protein
VKVAGRFHAWLFFIFQKYLQKSLERITRRITFVQVITVKTTKMKQNYTSKTDKIVRTVLIFAIIAIALGVTYTWYLHHIRQFGN